MAPGSPFGPGIAALILHLHVTQAVGFARLVERMDEVFGVALSEGAVANIPARAEAPMIVAADQTLRLLQSTSPTTCVILGSGDSELSICLAASI